MPNKEFDIHDELPEASLKKVEALAAAAHAATDTVEQNLSADPEHLRVSGQTYACVSFVSPHSNQKSEQMGMKIRGVFSSIEEAQSHAKKIMNSDNVFDTFVCSMYEWVLVPPDPEKISDEHYSDEKLNQIISGYKKNQLYAKEHFEERKRLLVEEAQEKAKREALSKLEGASITETVEHDGSGSSPVSDQGEGTPTQVIEDIQENVLPPPRD
jgi:hypothetical protein